jgi:uncharacterized protein
MSDNINLLQRMYAAFGSGDIPLILENVTDDVDWGTDTVVTEVPWYRIRQGRDGVGEFFASLAREVDFLKFEPNIFAAAGDDVFVHVDYEYRYKKNGKGGTISGVHQFTMRGNKVARYRAYEDTAAVRAAWNG